MVYRCSMLVYEFRRFVPKHFVDFQRMEPGMPSAYIPNGTCESGSRLAPLVRPHIIPPIGTASIVSRGQGQDPRNMMSAVVDLPRKTGRHTIKCRAAKESMSIVDVKKGRCFLDEGKKLCGQSAPIDTKAKPSGINHQGPQFRSAAPQQDHSTSILFDSRKFAHESHSFDIATHDDLSFHQTGWGRPWDTPARCGTSTGRICTPTWRHGFSTCTHFWISDQVSNSGTRTTTLSSSPSSPHSLEGMCVGRTLG